MTVKAQVMEMLDVVPDEEMPILLEIVKRFIPRDADDFASVDDLKAHKIAMQEYERGETVSHDDIDWD